MIRAVHVQFAHNERFFWRGSFLPHRSPPRFGSNLHGYSQRPTDMQSRATRQQAVACWRQALRIRISLQVEVDLKAQGRFEEGLYLDTLEAFRALPDTELRAAEVYMAEHDGRILP